MQDVEKAEREPSNKEPRNS